MRLIAATLALPGLAAAPDARTGEAALARAIAGRTAQPPVDCIDPTLMRSVRVVGGTALIWDAGGRLYVNRPLQGAGALRDDDIPVARIDGGQLCRIDAVTLLDRVTRMQRGFVVLGPFVPYVRAR